MRLRKETMIAMIHEVVGDSFISFHIENNFHECPDGTKANMRAGMKWTRDTIIRLIDKLYKESTVEIKVNYAEHFEASWKVHRKLLLGDILKLFIKNGWQIHPSWVDEFIRICREMEEAEPSSITRVNNE